ncbi:MAG: leucine-rich repeat protein [Ruminococcus sp.]|nr:leucine-rich repeat protein [Ruminococcus sp.]MCR5730336.1 leucine-rich repeat protein [Ruminococcus sp.]
MKAKKIVAALVSALSLNVIAAASIASAPLSASAENGTANNFTYETYNGYTKITGYKGTSKIVTVPATIAGHKVNAIADGFLKNNTNVTSVTVSKGIETIGDDFCSDATKLNCIYIKNGVKSFGDNFCSGANDLETVVLPYTLETIGQFGFYGCDYYTNSATDKKRFSTIKFYNSGDNITSDSNVSHIRDLGYATLWQTDWERQSNNMIIGQYLYRCKTLNVTGFNSSTGKLTMSTFDGHCIQYIGSSAFSGKTQIKSVDMSPVLYVGPEAFKNCSNLQYIYNPNAVRDIGTDAFNGTKWYNNNGSVFVTLGQVLYKYKGSGSCDMRGHSSITAISENAFKNVNITSIDLGNVNTYGKNAFANISGSGLATIKKYGNELDAYDPNYFYNNLEAFVGTKYAINRSEAKAKQIIQSCGLTWGKNPANATVAYKLDAIKKLRAYAATNWTYEFSNGNQHVEGALLFNKGVCASFADAYAYLLEKSGVNAQVLVGKGHAWNLVEYAPGQWAHVDITTAVCTRDTSNDVLAPGKRFLITDKQRYQGEGETTRYWEIWDTTNLRNYGIYDGTTHLTSNYSFGDLNSDGVINSADLVRLQDYLLGRISFANAEQFYHADFTLDGDVNVFDQIVFRGYFS